MSRSTALNPLSPKWRRESLHEQKLDWLSDGDSFRLTIRMSMSPSLSKSPNAQPRLQSAGHGRTSFLPQFLERAVAR